MTILAALQAIATVCAVGWSLYLLVFLLAAICRSPTVRALKDNAARPLPTLAVIVAAHDMESVITRCVQALFACQYPKDKMTVYVAADHCTDETAARAEALGATVLTRQDGPRGKTYTLAWTFETMTQMGIVPDLYVITDATAQVDPRFLAALAERWQQGEDIITSGAKVNSANQKWYARCLGLMLIHRNLQGWCRERLGLSVWLEGRGMAYSRNYIQRFGWTLALPTGRPGAHPTEDWRHGVRAAEQGFRVALAADAIVETPLKGSLVEATKQGARWERGRLINAGSYGLRVLLNALKERRFIPAIAALDAMQPPVALLGALSVGLALSALVFPGVNRLSGLAFVPLGLTFLYGMIIAIRGHRDGIHFITMFWAPLYIVWRCLAFVMAWVFLDRFGRSEGAQANLHS